MLIDWLRHALSSEALVQIRHAGAWARPQCAPKRAGPHELNISLLSLAHATVRVDVSRPRPWWTNAVRTAGFLWEYLDYILICNKELLVDLDDLVDYVRTSLVGRLGNGLCALFLADVGYTYVASFDAYLQTLRITHRGQRPDYVFAAPQRLLLAEAKATTRDGTVPRRLRAASAQVLRGFRAITANDGCATVGFLAPLGSRAASHLTVCWCTPHNTTRLAPPASGDPSAVTAASLASWLQFMRLQPLAQALTAPRPALDEKQSTSLFLLRTEQGGELFATPYELPFRPAPDHAAPLVFYVGIKADLLVQLMEEWKKNTLRDFIATLEPAQRVSGDTLYDGSPISMLADHTIFGLTSADTLNEARQVDPRELG